MGFSVGTVLWGEASVQAAGKKEILDFVATNGSGEQLDQPANGGVWVQNPLHRANRKAHGSSMGFSVVAEFGVRAPFNLPARYAFLIHP